jgi:hypothetical protein
VAGAALVDTQSAAKPAKAWDGAFLSGELWFGIVRGGIVAFAITFLFRCLPLFAIVHQLFSEPVQNDDYLWYQTFGLLVHELAFWLAAVMGGMAAGAMILFTWALIHLARPNRQPQVRRTALVGALLGPLAVVVAFTLPLLINHGPAKLVLFLVWHWLACLVAAPVGSILVSVATATLFKERAS